MRIEALLLAAALAGCSRHAAYEAPALDDEPVLAAAALADLPVRVPAYGIVLKNGQAEVNIEAADSKLVRPGQAAAVFPAPGRAGVQCAVVRVLAGASAETGQAIAWLAPRTPGALTPNDFVSASVTVAVKRRALAVPKSAVLVRDGKTLVVGAAPDEKGKTSYAAVEVTLGDESDAAVEIRSGLKPGDRVVVQGAIGLLYPEFKAAAD
jgi:cobalt-zinc-cadmium efflux system membrane fusion protein